MKEEPYMVTKFYESDKRYTIDEMEDKFASFCKQERKVERKDYDTTMFDKTYQFREIERLDFQEVVVRAYGSVGRSCTIDKTDRITLDGRLT